MRLIGSITLSDALFLLAGVWILQDRGTSWMFMLGLGLLAVGANRVARAL